MNAKLLSMFAKKKCLCFVTGFFKNRMLVFTSLTRWTVNFLLGQNKKKKDFGIIRAHASAMLYIFKVGKCVADLRVLQKVTR